MLSIKWYYTLGPILYVWSHSHLITINHRRICDGGGHGGGGGGGYGGGNHIR
jgi:hypothetical protein